MNYNEPMDIQVMLHLDAGFAIEDAQDLDRGLRRDLEPRFRVRGSAVQFDLGPGAPLPPDVFVQLATYILDRVDDVLIGVLSNYLYTAYTTGVKDKAGNALSKDHTWLFTTAGPSKK
jgi:hypothetical protein